MGVLSWLRGENGNNAAETENRGKEPEGTASFEDALLSALMGTGEVTRDMAMQVPTVSGGIDLIAGVIAGTPIKLYRETDGKAEEVKDDYRLRLLNDETGDTLNTNEFWRAMIADYYLGKGGYAYILKNRGKIKSLHYVAEDKISIIRRDDDPIFKEFDYQVGGKIYHAFDFLKILRNTRDGAEGSPITKENSKIIAASYQSLLLEFGMAKRGGRKGGFLQSEKKLDEGSMNALKAAFRELYTEGQDNALVLNNGVTFKEMTSTAVELQLNENKKANAGEFAKIFHISPDVISGGMENVAALAKLAAIPLMQTIQCALNRDLLLEREKGELYWAFDIKELLRGETLERYRAYQAAIDSNFLQIDEARFMEDLPPLGLEFIKLGLNDVLYDPKTKVIYTPNTNQTAKMEGKTLQGAEINAKMDEEEEPEPSSPPEERANPYHDVTGRFAAAAANMSGKEISRVSSAIFTNHPEYEAGTRHHIDYFYEKSKTKGTAYFYGFKVIGQGEYRFEVKIPTRKYKKALTAFRSRWKE